MVMSVFAKQSIDTECVLGLRCEEACKEIANEASNGVYSENIEGVVDAEEELDLRAVIACRASGDTVDDCGPGGNISRAWCDGYQAGNDTRAESDSGPFLLESVIQQAPGHTTNRSSKVSNHGSHDSTHARA